MVFAYGPRSRIFLSLCAGILLISLTGFADMQSEPLPSNDSPYNLVFYTEPLPPYNYEENGTIKGLSIDLLTAIIQKSGYVVPADHIQIVPWETALENALTQNNSVVFSTGRTPEREGLFQWVGPISIERDVLFAHPKANLSIEKPADLKEFRIGVTPGHAGTEMLLNAGVNKEQIVTEANISKLIRMLESGEIDLWCYPELTGRYYAEQVTGNYYAFNVVYPLEEMGIYYAFHRDVSNATVHAFQQALDELKTDKDETGVSEYERILGRYNPATGLSHLTYLTEEWAPYNYEKDGVPAGISIDILEKVFESLHVNKTREDVHFVPLSEGFKKMQTEIGTVLFSIVRSPEREALYQWAGPFTKGRFVLYASSSRNITLSSTEDLNNYTIGTVQGTIENTLLTNIGVLSNHITSGLHPHDLIRMLEEGTVDIWATGDSTGRYEMVKNGINPDKYEIVYTLQEDDFYFIFTRDVPESLIQSFNQTLMMVVNEKEKAGVST